MNNWANIEVINVSDSIWKYSKSDSNVVFTVEKKQKYEAKIDTSFDIELYISTDMNETREKWTLEKKPYFHLNFSHHKSINEIENIVYHLRDFIGFATSKPVYIVDLKTKDYKIDIGFKGRFQDKNLSENLQPYGMLYNLKDILKIGFENALRNWFSGYDQMQHVYRMLLLPHYFQTIISYDFLALAQTLESYLGIYLKTNFIKDSKLLKDMFNERKENVINNLPDNEEMIELKTWLEENLKFYRTFKDKINFLLDDYKTVFEEMNNKDNFVKYIVKTRNALSHGFSDEEIRKEKFCCSDSDLSWLYYGTKMILSAVLLRKIGFDDKIIIDLLKRKYMFKTLLENKDLFKAK